MPSSTVSSRTRDQTHISCILLHWQADSLALCYLGSLILFHSDDLSLWKKNVRKFKWELIDEQVQTTIIIVCILSMYTQLLSRVWLFATPWTVACQAPLSMEFSRQEYWRGLPFPSPGDFPNSGTELASPALQTVFNIAGGFFTAEPPGKPQGNCHHRNTHAQLQFTFLTGTHV